MRKKVSLLLASALCAGSLLVFLLSSPTCASSLLADVQGPTGTVCRLYVENVKTASSFKNAAASKSASSAAASFDEEAVALGGLYLVGRLARPGRFFVCTENATTADCRLQTTVSSLRSAESEFKGPTYGHATKTTMWQLDVIIKLLRRDEVVWSKVKTSSYEERRPISEAKFDNNIFHNLMTAALEQAADDVIDFFEGPEPAVGDGAPAVAGGVSGGTTSGKASRDGAKVDVRPPLAILKPEAGPGVTEQEVSLLWDRLESSVQGGAFRLVSRSDLPRMQEEIGFTTSSDLVNLASRDRARIGKIKTVSKLLATSIGRIGMTYELSIKVFDASTAEIDTSRSRILSAHSIDELLPQIAPALAESLAAAPVGIVLFPASAPTSAPRLAVAAFDDELARTLAQAGIAVKSGTAGSCRILPALTTFSVRTVPDGATFVYRGTVSGSISVEGAGVPPVAFALDDVELGREQGVAPSWLTRQYGKKLVKKALATESIQKWLQSLTNLK